MESSLKTQTQNTKGSVALLALFRLALLVGPETVILKNMGLNPVLSLAAAVAVLALWLSVDIWPFRATPAGSAAVSKTVAPQVKATPGYAQNLTKAQWWSYLFCRVVLFALFFHSKLHI